MQGSLMADSYWGKATGGGWFYDIETGNKCTFGFNAQFHADKQDPPNIMAKGQMQFVDHGAGQVIHISEMQSIEVNEEGYAMFTGTDKDGNPVTVGVLDAGEPGSLEGMEFKYLGMAKFGLAIFRVVIFKLE
jgi:hypothetical protein